MLNLPCTELLTLTLRTPLLLIKVPCRIPTIQLLDRKPIPQIRKAVSPTTLLINILPILAPKLLKHMEEVNPTPRVQRRDRTIHNTIFEPRPTAACPRGPRHEGINMRDKVTHSRLSRRDSFYPLSLALLDYPCNIFRYMLCDREDAAVADWGVGPEEDCACC